MSHSGEIEIKAKAYCKMLLHCAKYPHCTVNGVLLADSSKSKGNLVFVDAVPLFHICLNTTPFYEIAMTQIDAMAAKNNLIVAGFYAAEENYNNIGGEASYRIANKISEHCSNACLIHIDNRKFPHEYYGHKKNGDDPELPIVVSQFVDGKWQKRKDLANVIVGSEAVHMSETLINVCRKEVIDFDNHLDNVNMDWKNPRVNELIDEFDTIFT